MRSVAPSRDKYLPDVRLFVRDDDASEWHVVGDVGMLAPRHAWALCGRWPSSRAGWSEAVTERGGLRIHDMCRYWARIGGPWLYVRSSGQGQWHVVREQGDGPAVAPALCGRMPDVDGWAGCADKPIALDLHDDCRALRDSLDLDRS